MKKKICLLTAFAIVIIATSYYIIGNPFVAYNNYRLKQKVHGISKTEVTLNEIVPFEWDVVYTFPPYTSCPEIENIIGVKSKAIRETVNEGMVHLIFVKGDSVSASVCAYVESLGYRIDFSDKVEFGENKLFEVRIQDGIVCLTER